MATATVRGGPVTLALVCALGLAAVAGCGGPKRVTVSGSVTLDGAPLNAGVLHFYPDTAKGNNHRVDCLAPARGGKYTLLTQAVRDSETGTGAPLGWYKVYLDTTVTEAKINIHERFTDPNKTTVHVEVVESPAPGQYDVKFTSK